MPILVVSVPSHGHLDHAPSVGSLHLGTVALLVETKLDEPVSHRREICHAHLDHAPLLEPWYFCSSHDTGRVISSPKIIITLYLIAFSWLPGLLAPAPIDCACEPPLPRPRPLTPMPRPLPLAEATPSRCFTPVLLLLLVGVRCCLSISSCCVCDCCCCCVWFRLLLKSVCLAFCLSC